MSSCFTLKAPAKINLLLRITGRREDGFHELVTLFHPLPAVADEISVDLAAAPGITLSCAHPDVPENASNLGTKAAAGFAEKMGLAPTWHFELKKNIPVAAGMGGGSSDAGTILKFLAEQFPGCPGDELLRLAASLGADIPFFLSPADAAGRGIGEKLQYFAPLPMPPILAVFPNFPVSAAWAYKHLQSMTPPQQAEEELSALTDALRHREFLRAAELCANDLEAPLFEKFPLLRQLRRALLEQGALSVHISGSGPTLFALFADPAARKNAAISLGTPENLGSGIKIMEC